MLIMTLYGRYHYHHNLYFTDEETEAQSSLVACPWSQTQHVVELEFEPWQTISKQTICSTTLLHCGKINWLHYTASIKAGKKKKKTNRLSLFLKIRIETKGVYEKASDSRHTIPTIILEMFLSNLKDKNISSLLKCWAILKYNEENKNHVVSHSCFFLCAKSVFLKVRSVGQGYQITWTSSLQCGFPTPDQQK